MKIGYQLKQVRERLAKGLVDKGILRTEKRNFLLFDMATHPVADGGAKDEIRRRVRNVLTNRTVVLPASQFLPEGLEFRYLRTVSMVCAAYAANVLENAVATLGHESRERAFAQVDELLAEYSQWPFGKRAGGSQGIGANLGQVITDEVNENKDRELQMEVRQYGAPACRHPHGHIDPATLAYASTIDPRDRWLPRVWVCSPGWTRCSETHSGPGQWRDRERGLQGKSVGWWGWWDGASHVCSMTGADLGGCISAMRVLIQKAKTRASRSRSRSRFRFQVSDMRVWESDNGPGGLYREGNGSVLCETE